MVVLSCLPETTMGPSDDSSGSVLKPEAEPPHTHPHHRRKTNGSGDDENLLLPPETSTESAPLNPEVAVFDHRWEEVRADGLYVLNVDSNSNTVEEEGRSDDVGGGSLTTTTPCEEHFYPWPPAASRGTGIAEEPRLRPPPVDSTRPQDAAQQRAECTAGNISITAGGARDEERDERETGENDEVSKLFSSTGKSSEGERGSSTHISEAKRRVSEKEIIEPNGIESEGVGHTLPAAAAGLLAKLRDSIQRRVRTVPYSAVASEDSCEVETTEDPLCGKESVDGGTASRTRGLESRVQGAEEAPHPGTEDEDKRTRMAAAVGGGARGVVDSGIQHDAATDDDADDDHGTFNRLRVDGAPSVATPAASAAPVATARVGVLFSGGLDSVVLAAMLAENGGGRGPTVPKGEAIDLINVCFDR